MREIIVCSCARTGRSPKALQTEAWATCPRKPTECRYSRQARIVTHTLLRFLIHVAIEVLTDDQGVHLGIELLLLLLELLRERREDSER
jgi:hypothetical protein